MADENTRRRAMTEDEIQSHVGALIDQAEDYVTSDLNEAREENWNYYRGYSAVPKQAGRHDLTMTKTRDFVRMVEPAILRPFAYKPNAIEFCGTSAAGRAVARDMTNGMRHWFYERNDGWRLLVGGIREGLVNDSIAFQVKWSDEPETIIHQLNGLSLQELSALSAQKNIRVIGTEQSIADGGEPVIEATVEETTSDGRLVFSQIKLENVLIDRGATSAETARLLGVYEEITVGEGVKRGYDRELLIDAVGIDNRNTAVEAARRDVATVDADFDAGVEDDLPVLIYEVYVQLDPDGRGVTTRHRVMAAGDGGKRIISYEPAKEHGIVIGSLYPLPHSPFGEGMVEGLKDDQNAATSVMREMLDNLQLNNRPGMAVVDGMVNLDDLMNTELGRMIRQRAPRMMEPITVPFVGKEAMPVLAFLDQQMERKTGVSSAAMGFSPDMLQSTTKAAVDAANMAASGQTEYMARNFAETCLAPLFAIGARLLAENASQAFWVEMNGQPLQIDPRRWRVGFFTRANVGLGTGSPMEKLPVLWAVAKEQKEIIATMGLANGVVKASQLVHTFSEILQLVGIYDPERYFVQLDPQTELKLAQADQQRRAQAAQSQNPPDPSQAIVMAEQIKSKTRMAEAQQKGQLDLAKLAENSRLRREEMQLRAAQNAAEQLRDDDLRRDSMLQDLVLRAADIMGKYGTQVDVAKIRAQQAATGVNNGAAS